MTRYDPYEHAEAAGIRVVHRPLRVANGLWVPDENLIIIRERMRSVHDRSALAHELGHAHYGHRDDRPKHEVQADRYAASNLIDLTECLELTKWSPDCHKLAAELDVSTRLMRVFLNVHHLVA